MTKLIIGIRNIANTPNKSVCILWYFCRHLTLIPLNPGGTITTLQTGVPEINSWRRQRFFYVILRPYGIRPIFFFYLVRIGPSQGNYTNPLQRSADYKNAWKCCYHSWDTRSCMHSLSSWWWTVEPRETCRAFYWYKYLLRIYIRVL
jgi:hypothetical protein